MTKEAKKDLQATEQIIEDRLKLMEKYTQSVWDVDNAYLSINDDSSMSSYQDLQQFAAE